jgi:methyl-accepting chemotaxis protein
LEGTKKAGLALEEMVSGIGSAATSATEGSEATNQLTLINENLNRNVKDLLDKISIVKTNSEESYNNIVSVTEAVKQISDFVRNIENIADQSKMLSLNAAIEAARAGEAGRGFTVVANEVHTLAEASHDSVKQIEKLISVLSSTTNNTIKNIRTENQNVDDMVITSHETKATIENMTKEVSKVHDMIQNIAAITEEQSASTTEIAELRKLSEASISSLSEAVESICHSSEETTKASEQIAYESQSLSQNAEELTNMINKFKTE